MLEKRLCCTNYSQIFPLLTKFFCKNCQLKIIWFGKKQNHVNLGPIINPGITIYFLEASNRSAVLVEEMPKIK